uniref:Nudix (nucleoside diphosphate linked moiety X)-type motif 22 n=1 Tax=Amphiprion percula TaxID=161767 RepID=A0A3P8SLE2_AMPPE
MDPDVSVLLHCERWQGLLESQVQVELSERFNRQRDPAVERHIDELWTERVSREPWLFNGAKFRLHSFCFAPPKHPPSTRSSHIPLLNCAEDQVGQTNSRSVLEDVLQQTHGKLFQDSSACCCTDISPDIHSRSGPLLTLRLGLTCYKDYLGTNWSSQVAELRRRGEAEFSDPLALLAQPLGVGAVLRTADGRVVLIRRSQKVAEAGGLLDIPGGHPEPKVVCERLGQAVCEENINVEMMQQKLEVVVSELFSSVCAEIRDEVNVPLSSLGEPVLMGVGLNHTSAGRPSAEFYVSCSLTSDEVRKLYWKGGPEAHESTDVIFLSRTELLQLDSSSPLWSELCPSAKGAVILYQTVKPDGGTEKTTPQNGPT